MKKYFLSLVAIAAAMLFATSCQESLVEPQIEGPTTFTVQLPDQMGTKAIGDKENVNQLLVAVYSDANVDPVALTRATATSTSGEFKVQFNLLQDQSYDIVFWAQVENEYVAANNDFELKSITMKNDYHNNENGAAFFAYVADFVPTGSAQSVTLKRPFAQLNLGTTLESLQPATGEVSLVSSEIKIKGLAQVFNTISGMGEEPTTEVVTYSATIPENWQKLSAAGSTYEYVSMDYLPIVGDDKAVFDIEANIVVKDAVNAQKTIKHKFTSVPVQENYRTNIVGNLISSTSDFIVSIDDRFVDKNNDNISDDNNILVVENAAAAQTALDNAKPGDVITLVAGVNYGTLKFRANPGHINTTLEDIADAWSYNYNRSIKDITIIGAEGATVDQFKFETGALPGDCNNRVTVNNLVIDGVEFTDALTASSAGYNAPIMITTSNATIDGLTVKNCKLIGDNSKLNLVYLYGADGSKNVSLINNKVEGVARLCELRGTENVTIKGNVIKNTYEHAMLLAGGGYAGNVTITGNTADGIRDRFVRMAGAENATVSITGNTITNYQGADADYIKVTGANDVVINGYANVTIENNTLTSRVVPANNAEDVVLNTETIEVTIPAESAETGATYKVVVTNENTETDATTGETTVGFDLTMYKNDVKVSGDVIYEVTKNLGAGLIISEVTHNGTALTEANTGDDQTYKYNSTTGVLTIYTKSFSPFQIIYGEPIAQVGNKQYSSIAEAIAAWTHNTTLTLLADVTLSDVITLKSTEYHVLDLGIYTMTAAKGKDAIKITAEGRTSASYALDIKADANNPGGIIATSKAVVKTTGKSGVKDRPIIRFYNGVFNASNIISHSGSNGTNCPQFQFHGGVYNGTIYANRALIQFYGGTFNGSLQISVDSSAYALISGGRFKQLSNLYGSALNSDKFTIGSSKGNFDRGIYVDDEGYYVVGGSVITEFGDKFAAKASIKPGVYEYLYYSSAKDNGLYYTNAQMAIDKYGAENVVLK